MNLLHSKKTLILLVLVPIALVFGWTLLRQRDGHPSAAAAGIAKSRFPAAALLGAWLTGPARQAQSATPAGAGKQPPLPAAPGPPGLGAMPPTVFFRALPRFQFENTNVVDRCLMEFGVRGMRMPQPQMLTFARVDPGPGADPKEVQYRVTRVKSLPGPGGPQNQGPDIERPPSVPPLPDLPVTRPGDCVQRLLQTTIRIAAGEAERPKEFSAVIPVLMPVPEGVPGGPLPPGDGNFLAGKGMRAP